ncbi:hypothetical protein [Streptomyces sp. ST2-7A]|uniref:hypothetical protein n=1 Tax=Streptomyces sp. ST2-7A TaxID=2907214 RepID=UPI001F3DB28F|nr:hypothetical protein [Streptomyces sp. ST2-7A]MCE7079988.1 hypothetical protein [Streptomyces sp. ST2-7A]
MLAVRLARRGPLPLLARRAPLFLAAGGTCLLLLGVLADALDHRGTAGNSALSVIGCLLPLAATGHLAATLARAHPSPSIRSELGALGAGRGRTAAMIGASSGVFALLGCLPAVALFLYGRAIVDGTGNAPAPLPPLGTPTLVALVPLVVAGSAALAARLPVEHRRSATPTVPAPVAAVTGPGNHFPGAASGAAGAVASRGTDRGRTSAAGGPPVPAVPAGGPSFSAGAALIGAGVALTALTAPGGPGHPGAGPWELSGVPAGIGPGVVFGWALVLIGTVVAGPGLLALCGRLLSLRRPGVRRMLAGRALLVDAPHRGRAFGVLVAASATVPTGLGLLSPPGALTALGLGVTVFAALAAVPVAGGADRWERAEDRETLSVLGAPRAMAREVVLLRLLVGVPVALLAATLVAWLLVLPFG